VFLVRGRKDRPELLGGRKVDGVIEPRIRTDTPLKATCAPINLSKQLHLEPPLVVLHGFSGGKRTGQFSYPNQAHGSHKVHQSLWNAH
jgi:hypothetical protein